MMRDPIFIPGVGNVRFPEFMSDAEVEFAAGRLYREANQPEAPEDPPVGAGQAALIGAGRAFTQLGRGAANLFGAGIEKDPTEESAYSNLQAQHPIATAIGESAPYVAGGGIAGMGIRGAGAIPAIVRQAEVGAAIGAAMDGTPEERLARGATEGLLSGAGEGVGRVIGRVIAPRLAPSNADTASARQLGYRILPSTEAEGMEPLRQTIEGGLESMPGSASAMAGVTRKNQAVLNKDAAAAIGETAKGVTSDVLGKARKRIGKTLNGIMSKDLMVPVDDDLLSRFRKIDDEEIRVWIADSNNPTRKLLDRAYALFEKGEIPADELNKQQSRLGKLGKQALRGENSNPDLAHALFDMQEALLDAAGRSVGPEDALRFQAARRQYFYLSAIEAGQNIDPVSGKVHAGRMASYLQRRDRPGFTEGGNKSPLYEGVRFLGRTQPTLPSSGTAERSYMMNALGLSGGGVVGAGGAGYNENDPITGAMYGAATGVLAPYGLARSYLAKPMQRWLTHAMTPAEDQASRALAQSVIRWPYQ